MGFIRCGFYETVDEISRGAGEASLDISVSLMLYGSGGQLDTSRGPNLTYRTPSRARSSVSFRREARG
jgi:hypothetical protein